MAAAILKKRWGLWKKKQEPAHGNWDKRKAPWVSATFPRYSNRMQLHYGFCRTHASRRLVSIDIWETFCDIDTFRANSITTARGIYDLRMCDQENVRH